MMPKKGMAWKRYSAHCTQREIDKSLDGKKLMTYVNVNRNYECFSFAYYISRTQIIFTLENSSNSRTHRRIPMLTNTILPHVKQEVDKFSTN